MTQPTTVALGDARLKWDGARLTLDSGPFHRSWHLTATGLATATLRHAERAWVEREPGDDGCDWYLFRLVGSGSRGELTDLRLREQHTPRLTHPHVEATAEFTYPDKAVAIRYVVRAYPGAAGVRTQIAVKALRSFGREEAPGYPLESYAEALPFDPSAYERCAIGYYNDPQHRNHDDTPLLRREKRSGDLAEGPREIYDWANLLDLRVSSDTDPACAGGLVLLKESHKCVNQSGLDTGAFVLRSDGLRVTGLGLKPNNYVKAKFWLRHDSYRTAWANWCVPYAGGEAEMQLALKRFDRARFQTTAGHARYSRSNTWGTRKPGPEAQAAASGDNLLREIESAADLGIDVVAIDDGWQCPAEGGASGAPDEWAPHPERFPTGWVGVREAAEKAGVNLQLWLPGARATLGEMLRNIEQGGFTGLKVDFLNFPTRDLLDSVLEKIDRAVAHLGDRLLISWDVTEMMPRLGYYFGREYGSLHIANRTPGYPGAEPFQDHIAYTPRLVLRDAWHLAHYLNLDQIEICIQDVERLDPDVSNAPSHSYAYATAIALAGLPLFFQETQFLGEGGRQQIRELLALWREHREAMDRSFVFPIGEEPCDAAWTGFQIHDPETGNGYLILFRELHAESGEYALTPLFLNPETTAWHELSGAEPPQREGKALRFRIDPAPGFRWYRYAPETIK